MNNFNHQWTWPIQPQMQCTPNFYQQPPFDPRHHPYCSFQAPNQPPPQFTSSDPHRESKPRVKETIERDGSPKDQNSIESYDGFEECEIRKKNEAWKEEKRKKEKREKEKREKEKREKEKREKEKREKEKRENEEEERGRPRRRQYIRDTEYNINKSTDKEKREQEGRVKQRNLHIFTTSNSRSRPVSLDHGYRKQSNTRKASEKEHQGGDRCRDDIHPTKPRHDNDVHSEHRSAAFDGKNRGKRRPASRGRRATPSRHQSASPASNALSDTKTQPKKDKARRRLSKGQYGSRHQGSSLPQVPSPPPPGMHFKGNSKSADISQNVNSQTRPLHRSGEEPDGSASREQPTTTSHRRQEFHDCSPRVSAKQRQYPSPPEKYQRRKGESGASRSDRRHQREAENLRNDSPPLRVAEEIYEIHTSRRNSRGHDAELPFPGPEQEVTNRHTDTEWLNMEAHRYELKAQAVMRKVDLLETAYDSAMRKVDLLETAYDSAMRQVDSLEIDYDRAKRDANIIGIDLDRAKRDAEPIEIKLDRAIEEAKGYIHEAKRYNQDAERAAAKLREAEDVETKQKMKRRITLENPDQACLDDEGVY